MLTITAEVGDDAVLAAAVVWTRAKARRDGQPAPDSTESGVVGVRRRLALEGSTLLTARREDRVLGFALFAPRSDSTELFYLAVDPDAWGGGVGAALLEAVDGHALEAGRPSLELWVLDDNARAISVYERAGWVATDEVVRDQASGRVERRFVRRRWSGSRHTRRSGSP